jgi:hypothetical protein
MRMEELANNNFIKGTDTVERYLLDIIKQYFSSSNINEDSREYIIKKAVSQMKEELNIDNAGVVSVNGQTGEVTITLESLGGEPLISPKLSAFNVNFGTEENTACRGNDPRLSDNRHPLPHTHEMSEINGLDGEISSIKNTISILDGKTHNHNNLKLLNMLIYSGNKSEIDLTLLDNAEDKINTEITIVDNTITDIQTKINDLTNLITNELNQYSTDYSNIKTYIDDKNTQLKTDIKQYCDTEIQNKKDAIDTEISKMITKTQLNSFIDALNQQFSVLYETDISDFITTNDSDIIYDFSLPTTIVNELSNLTDEEYKIDFYINYTDPVSNKNVIMNLPFVYAESGNLLYIIKGELIDKSIVRITSSKNDSSAWATFIDIATIRIKVSTKNNLAGV